ncbi:hypothetical protein N7509_013423 [Penicillium cosmopolitanum]|uniref:Uncharacterized protein n=1 Tax=Penicillium cosmopolitanum TaxID=1131564 RepID=A0A9W9SDA1_9EURO|nr:uncharacterized protein N7509_013423 [Penicillium cosmopolitanum]KAJ5376537.1 hypothetical protein N7509_013423 [Penicillium cosmopolitanum]
MAQPARNSALRYFDVAVTFTADQFRGIYRGKQYHEPDFAEVLKRAKDYGCEKVMLTTMSLEGAKQNLQLVREFPEMCKMTLGVHPYHAGEIYEAQGSQEGSNQYLETIRKIGEGLFAEKPSPLAAFGEIGLDYVYLDRADKETQQRAFRDQLEMATEFQLPLFLHVRESTEDFISIIKPYLPKLPRGGLVHSFAGSKAEMLQLVELGLDISVNGVSFRSDEQIEMAKYVPFEQIATRNRRSVVRGIGNGPENRTIPCCCKTSTPKQKAQ